MKHIVTALALSLTFAVSAFAQSTAVPNSRIAWDQPNVASAAVAQSYTYKYYPDGATAGIALTGVTCTGTAPVQCSAGFPAFTPGSHTLTLSATNAAGESPKSATLSFVFVVVPSAPSNLQIQ